MKNTEFARYKLIARITLFFLFVFCIYSTCVGIIDLSIKDIFISIASKFAQVEKLEERKDVLIWAIRLPRTALSILVGALLGSSGAAIQGLFRNPLADPSIVGISSGSAFFSLISIMLSSYFFCEKVNNLFYLITPIFSFLGAIFALFILLSFSWSKKSISFLLLLGIALNALFASFTALLIYSANDLELRNFTFWTLGSLSGASWEIVGIILLGFIVSFSLLLKSSRKLNILTLGEQEAETLGIKVRRLRTTLLIAIASGVSLSVAFCGFIGFVGLVVPHILRSLGINNNKFLIISSALLGALLLLISDIISRVILLPAELPVGIITSLIGSPFFIFLLLKKKLI